MTPELIEKARRAGLAAGGRLEDVEDAIQEVNADLVERSADLNGLDHPGAYFKKAAKNQLSTLREAALREREVVLSTVYGMRRRQAAEGGRHPTEAPVVEAEGHPAPPATDEVDGPQALDDAPPLQFGERAHDGDPDRDAPQEAGALQPPQQPDVADAVHARQYIAGLEARAAQGDAGARHTLEFLGLVVDKEPRRPMGLELMASWLCGKALLDEAQRQLAAGQGRYLLTLLLQVAADAEHLAGAGNDKARARAQSALAKAVAQARKAAPEPPHAALSDAQATECVAGRHARVSAHVVFQRQRFETRLQQRLRGFFTGKPDAPAAEDAEAARRATHNVTQQKHALVKKIFETFEATMSPPKPPERGSKARKGRPNE